MEDPQQEYQRLIAPIEERMMCTVWRIVQERADAEDAFQDALLSIWRRWDQVRRHPNPHALVLRICIQAAQDKLRHRVRAQKRTDHDVAPEQIPDSGGLQSQGMLAAEQSPEVLRAVGVLPAKQAQAILMHVLGDFSYSEIAQAMRCGEATARKHAARARARLRTLLSHLSLNTQKEERIHA